MTDPKHSNIPKNVRMKIQVMVIAAVLATVAILCALYCREPAKHPEITVSLQGHVLTLEVVTSTADLQKGLGGRASMPPDHGMLFLFAESNNYPFWTKGMHFPLDIIWLNNGTIVAGAINMRPPAASFGIPDIYAPNSSANQVIELNADQLQRFGLYQGVVIPELTQ